MSVWRSCKVAVLGLLLAGAGVSAWSLAGHADDSGQFKMMDQPRSSDTETDNSGDYSDDPSNTFNPNPVRVKLFDGSLAPRENNEPSESKAATQPDISSPAAIDSYKFDNNQKIGADPDFDFEDRPDVETSANPEHIYVPFSFPHLTGYFGYRPGYFSINQTLESGSFSGSSPNFQYTSYVPVSFAFGGALQLSSQLQLEAAFSVAMVSVDATQLAIFSLNQSTATVFQGVVTPYYCFSTGAFQICPGVGLGVDGFPVMQFDSNDVLSLASYTDMVVRGTVKASYPLTRVSSLGARIGYDQGILDSSATGTTTTLHRSIWGELEFLTPYNPKFDFHTGIRVEQETTNYEQSPDVWSDSAMLYSLYFGIAL